MTTILPAVTTVPATVMEPTALQLLWFLLVGVLVIGYFVLDGFDLGSGALYPFIAKDVKEKALVRRAIGPLWDGNEVWLLTGGGALFAAFPAAYATSFSGFYLAIMLVLFSLIFRAVSVEFRGHDHKWHKLWDVAFFLGSALPALLFGVAVGNVVAGVPLNSIGDYAGLPLVGLLGIFPLTCGLVSLSVMLLQGAAWQALKAPLGSALRARALKVRSIMVFVAPATFILATAAFFLFVSPEMATGLFEIVRYLSVALVIVAAVGSILMGRSLENATSGDNKRDMWAFLSVSVYPFGLVLLAAGSLFPYMIRSVGPGPSISVASAGSSEVTLTAMTIIACIGVPLVLIYHVVVYRLFRGRLTQEDTNY
jgi:cytochrome d ubiquinol oxidase subunit II